MLTAGGRIHAGSFEAVKAASPFSVEGEIVRQTATVNRAIAAGLLIVGLTGFATPMFLGDRLPRESRMGMLLASVAAWAGLGLVCNQGLRSEKLLETFQEAKVEVIRNRILAQMAAIDTQAQVQQTQAVYEQIQTLPEHQLIYFAEELGLEGMIDPAMLPPMEGQPMLQTQAQIEGAPEELTTIDVAPQQSLEEMQQSLLAGQVDYTWCSDQFMDESKVVFGAKGSGKSTYLRAEAAKFMKNHPNGKLLIGDIHFDVEDVKECSWLNGIPMETQLKLYVADRAQKVLNQFRVFKVEMVDRVEHKDKSREPWKLICDEYNGVVGMLSPEEIREILDTIEMHEFQCRKFNKGGGITLGIHNLKKGKKEGEGSGLDSSILANMHIMALGKALADPNIVLPSDFDVKKLEAERSSTAAMLHPSQGRACVVRTLGDDPMVAIMRDWRPFTASIKFNVTGAAEAPKQDEPDAWDDSVSSSNPDPLGHDQALLEMKQWFQSRSIPPTDREIIEQYQALTGRPWNNEANLNGLVAALAS